MYRTILLRLKCWCGQVNTEYREITSLRRGADLTLLRQHVETVVESFRELLHMTRIFLAAPDIYLNEKDVCQTDSIQKSYFYIRKFPFQQNALRTMNKRMRSLINETDFVSRCDGVVGVMMAFEELYKGTSNKEIKGGLRAEFMAAGLISDGYDLKMIPGTIDPAHFI